MNTVFVVDKNRLPLDPCSPRRARILLDRGRAAVYRYYPFTIIMKDRLLEDSVVHEHRIKIDPGSKTTGFAIIQEETGKVIFAAELEHRGQQIKASMDYRRSTRRNRRNRKTRYRSKRFLNRTRKPHWFPSSLESRLSNITTWVLRLRWICNVTAISMELVKFDLQKIDNPEISGLEYQQGELQGYEIREYLLEKWGRTCVYCSKGDLPLQVEHVIPRSNGGTNRVSNLTLSCEKCNKSKGSLPVEVFLKSKPDLLERIKRQLKTPLKDAAAVNSTRWELYRRLNLTGLPIECGSGGRTKFNRIKRNLSKAHWIDAVCVGASTPEVIKMDDIRPVQIKAYGHGCRQMCRTDKYGFPVSHKKRLKTFMGFRTGDIVKANILRGKYQGFYRGRVSIRFIPTFTLNGFDVHSKYLKVIHKSDGYSYCVN